MTKRLQAAFAVLVLTACGDSTDSTDSADSTAMTVDRTPTTVAIATTATTDDVTTTTTAPVATTTTTDTTTTTTTTTTTIGAEPQGETAAVLKAYTDHWAIFYAFINGEPPGDPADYFAGARLANLPGTVAEFAERDLEVGGEALFAPGPVTINGDAAFFTDCQLDMTFAVSRATGETVIQPSTTPQLVTVEMLRSDGVWKVSFLEFEDEGSCVQ